MTVKDYIKTHPQVYSYVTSFEMKDTKFVVTFYIPKIEFIKKKMTPDREQRVHGFHYLHQAEAHANLLRKFGALNVKVRSV